MFIFNNPNKQFQKKTHDLENFAELLSVLVWSERKQHSGGGSNIAPQKKFLHSKSGKLQKYYQQNVLLKVLMMGWPLWNWYIISGLLEIL